jgi:beta-lactam-binding protein with PASTA domain
MRWLLRALLRLAYLAVVAVLFVAAAYLGFSGFVRRGVTPVPSLVGLGMEEARERLADQGLRVRHEAAADRFADDVPAGRVVEQRPGAASLAKRGGSVTLVLSRGRRVVPVPELVGSALPAAQVTLTAAGLSAGTLAEVAADRPVGTVVAQDPAPGVTVGPGTTVRLYFAGQELRETYVMPDLIDREYRRVRELLDANGFRVGSVKFEPYEGVTENTVLRQFPLPGHPLRRGEVVSLVVAAVPEPVTLSSSEPTLSGAGT